MTPDPGSLLPVALQAVATACDLIRTRRPASVTEKDDRDIVSDVDVAVERAVRAYLREATPDIGFLGEEEGGTTDLGTGWLWTLDPIDGTSNYAHAIPLCAVSLALLHDGRPVLGVIDAPFLGERYHAVEGHGAWTGDRRLTGSTATSMRDAIVAIGDYATGAGAGRKNETRLAATIQLTSRVHRIRMLGTAALDLAWLADGRLDASITLANEPWDVAAGVIIAREAGAAVVDVDGSPHSLRSAATIAAPAALLSQLLPLIQAADLQDTESQDTYISPYATLDTILSQARYLIFEFDGPVCDLSAVMPADTGGRLRAILVSETGSVPPAIAATSDPAEILAYTASVSQGAAARADDELASIELAAAGIAAAGGYIHEALAACRDSGRTAAIVSRRSERAVADFLDRLGLDDQIRHVTAVGSYPPGHLQTGPHLIEDTIRALGAAPADCALITASVTGIDAARKTGIHAIGYATTPGTSQNLTDAGTTCIVQSLADLTLRLRARPLPN